MDWIPQKNFVQQKKDTEMNKRGEAVSQKNPGYIDREIRLRRKESAQKEKILQKKSEDVVQCVPDPVEEIALEGDMEMVRAQVNEVMEVIRNQVMNNVEMVHKLQENQGRDAWVYAGIFRRNDSLLQILESWDNTWSLERTCGLLLDLGLVLRRLCDDMEIMNDTLIGGRDRNTHRVDRNSAWAREFVPENARLQAGPSATTGQLLRLLHNYRDVIDRIHMQSVMVGAIQYWKNGSWIKRIMGDYHTAVEVWAVYMHYLEEVPEQTPEQTSMDVTR